MGARARETVRVVIEGRVQGVGFRDWLARQARAAGVDGWVRNRADGAVEAVLAGPAGAVEDLVALCRRGPAFARVTDLRTQAGEEPVPAGFRITPTA